MKNLVAALNRLLHRSTVINIRSDGYKLKEKRKAKSTATNEGTTDEQLVPYPGGQF